ncbi:helix-turn-helix domain-containing protein [Paenalcaligenes niemegkensis]|uniref:helix-turn-helix domain-containing protein n=1 Tax=Paenalcaligenes niemegkensis TaxID=2895469 RepID=UPI0035635141
MSHKNQLLLDNDATLRKPQACLFLSISSATLDRWVRTGILKRRKIGRISLYRLGDLRALVRNAEGEL